MKGLFTSFTGIILIIFLTSCGKMLMWTFGMRNPKPYTEKDIKREARKQGIPKEHVYVLDTTFNQLFDNDDTSSSVKLMLKNHIQPAQALYYNSEGELISFHINCYAHGMKSKWNHFGDFDQFPPESAAPIDTLLALQEHLSFIRTLDGRSLTMVEKFDYVCIIYFNRVIRARNRRLVKEVNRNAALNKDGTMKILYVNTDNFYFHCLDMDGVEL